MHPQLPIVRKRLMRPVLRASDGVFRQALGSDERLPVPPAGLVRYSRVRFSEQRQAACIYEHVNPFSKRLWNRLGPPMMAIFGTTTVLPHQGYGNGIQVSPTFQLRLGYIPVTTVTIRL